MAAAPASPFFPSMAAKRLLENVTSWCVYRHGFYFTFFPADGDETPSKKRHIFMSAVTVSKSGLWMQYFTKKLSLQSFRRKYCTIKDGAQTYDFIADKSCLLISIILNVLCGWEVIRTQGKCIKSYNNFWKDFVVEQNLTRPKADFWNYLRLDCSRLDNRTIGNMDPCR